MEPTMKRALDPQDVHHLDRRGFKLLGLAGGVVIGVLLGVLARPGPDTAAEREWIEDSAPRAVPAAPRPSAALDEGVDWGRAEAWDEYGPAAVAAYER
jgi:hypothetical protein